MKRLQQLKKARRGSLVGYLVFLLLLGGSLPTYLLASEETEVTYQISEKDLTTLENNLTQLKEQFKVQQQIQLSLANQLTIANNELTSAKTSLNELESKVKSQLNKEFWVGVGVGVGVTALITLICLFASGVVKN